ncbi:MAG: fibronectin type III domain-containing protein [bacterium]|nr:fibronectin type III domain-containing protein [bacterium]
MRPRLRRSARRLAAATVAVGVVAATLWGLAPSRPADAQSAGFSTPNLASGDDVTFRGAGWGHGVGISHQSLPARIAAGQTARDILSFYYPGTVLTGGWQLNDLRVYLASATSSRFRPRGPFELVLDGAAVYSSSATELFSVARDGNGWAVETGGGASLCPEQICRGNVLQIRTADGTAVESSATRHSYSHGQITLTKLAGDSWYRIVLTDLDLEHYLRGVAEVPPDWPAEALRAQAVASRTYALHVARENRSSDTWTAPFDVYDDTQSQVYSGNTREQSPRNGPWLQAVADTAGQVLTYDAAPALTLFTTSGGGYTENSGYAFKEQMPYLLAAEDPYTTGDPYTPWTRTYSVGALSRWLARAADTDVGTLRRIDVSGNISVSGRIDRAAVRLTGSSGAKSVTGQRFVFVVNKGAESEGWGPLPNAAGRGGHLLSTKFTFSEAGSPPAVTVTAPPAPAGDPPGAPQSVSLSPGPGEIVVSWQPPADDGGIPITGYTITWASSTGASGTIGTTDTTRTLRNLANGATYTIGLTASNAAGASAAITASATPLGAPSAPRELRLQRGDGRLGASWSPPANDGGLAVESYTVYWTAPEGATTFATTRETDLVISGLTNGSPYTVAVTATNGAGTSSRSEPASHRPGTPPGAPRDVTAVQGDGRVEASWRPPAHDGGLGVTSYTIAWASSTGATGTIETADVRHTLRNLLNGATYTITVTAANEAGTSPTSGPASASPAAPPGAPAPVTVDRGDGRVDLTWQPPESDGGRPVLSYTVAWTAPDGTTGSAQTDATSHTFEGLVNGTAYTFTVSADNEVGASPASEPASGTPAHIPGAPLAVRTERDDSRVRVAWDPPASDGGLGVTGYTLLWVAPDGTTDSADTTATSHTIEGLDNGVTYGITVTATNEVGRSVAADPVRATPARPPGPIPYAEIAIGHESLLVSWEPPSDDGGLPVRSYTLSWTAPDGAVTSVEVTRTSHTIEDLIGGAAYNVTILANNEAGPSAAALSAQATPQGAAAPTAVAGTGALTAAAAPAAPPAAPEGPPAAPAAPVEAAADSSPARTRSWQDAATNDTAVIVLAGVGLVLIAALLVVTRRQRHLVEETSADVADVW